MLAIERASARRLFEASPIRADALNADLEPDGLRRLPLLIPAAALAPLTHEVIVEKYGLVVCRSEAMRTLMCTVAEVANDPSHLLITGESGSGKGMMAAAIHARSRYRAGPLVTVNCTGFPNSCLRAELFGSDGGGCHRPSSARRGQIEAAVGGTLFLDNIDEMPLELQAVVLQTLQERRTRRPGSPDPILCDVRLLLATAADPATAVSSGHLHSGFIQEGIVRIAVPPLRSRRDDLEVLAWRILQKLRYECSGKGRGFAQKAIEAMHAHRWSGNGHELINRIRHALVLGESEAITATDLRLA